MKKIITIEETFLIPGRGLVVTGREDEDNAEAQMGDTVEILRPDKTKLKTQIIGIEMICRKDPADTDRTSIGLLLKVLSKEDIPPGSEIFLPEK
jgi:translation elongation factor EF-Tu-like GTPase